MESERSSILQAGLDPLQGVAHQHPMLAWAVSALFLAGLVIDVLILVAARRAPGPSGAVRFTLVAKPWGLAEVGFITVTLCSMLLVGSLVISYLEHAGLLSGRNLDSARMLASGVIFDGVGIFAIFLLLRTGKISVREAFGIQANSAGRAFGRAIFFFLAIIPPTWILAGISQEFCRQFDIPISRQNVMEMFLNNKSLSFRVGIASVAIVFAPLFEELFFRGLAYPALKQKIGPAASILLTSLVFAAIHIHLLSFLPLFALAMGLTLAYEATGNLLVPIVMHSLFNLMTIAVMFMVPT